MSHNHSSSCVHDHDHDHDHGPPPGSSSDGEQQSLYSKIDTGNVRALNALGGERMGGRVVKSWEDREEETLFCESDADDSLIISIPFTAQVKLRSLTIKSGPTGLTPSKVQLYINTPGLDFAETETRKCTEEINLLVRREGVEYPVRPSKFSQVSSLQLFFPGNVSAGEEETSRVYYIGLKGEWNEFTKNPEGVIVYEINPRLVDHKVKGDGDMAGSNLGI